MNKAENLARQYLTGLAGAYRQAGAGPMWDEFFTAAHGAAEEDLERLKQLYPAAPDSLTALLAIIDGTYWREYQGKTFVFYLLGSDIEEYPYYLLSARQMAESRDMAAQVYGDYADRLFEEEGVQVDEKIIRDSKQMRWLHFSDCMNNGGTSQLFVDFSPSPEGKSGQIVRFLHDPDELQVIADSFVGYMQMLMDNGYDYINADTVEE